MVRWAQIARFVVGLALVPVCVAAAISFGEMMINTGPGPTAKGIHALGVLALGAVTYVVIFVFLHKSVLRTVFGREPVQTMWSTITGYRLPQPAAGGESHPDSPTDEKGRRIPLWAVLAPYLIPIYTAVGVLVVWLLKLLVGMSGSTYAFVQAYVIGLTYTFHVFLVANDIRKGQRDLKAAGYLFTLVLLFVVNVEVLAAFSMIVFPNADWIVFNQRFLGEARREYLWFWELITGWIR